MTLPERCHLLHEVPPWVKPGACFFITICCEPRRTNQLATPTAGPRLLESIANYHHAATWWVHLALLMPDHLHALIAAAPDRSLATTIRAWKSWQTKTLGIVWQSGFFDHRLRSDESL